MKIGDLVKYKDFPHIYVVIGLAIESKYDFVLIHCLEDGDRVFEDSRFLVVL